MSLSQGCQADNQLIPDLNPIHSNFRPKFSISTGKGEPEVQIPSDILTIPPVDAKWVSPQGKPRVARGTVGAKEVSFLHLLTHFLLCHEFDKINSLSAHNYLIRLYSYISRLQKKTVEAAYSHWQPTRRSRVAPGSIFLLAQ